MFSCSACHVAKKPGSANCSVLKTLLWQKRSDYFKAPATYLSTYYWAQIIRIITSPCELSFAIEMITYLSTHVFKNVICNIVNSIVAAIENQ